MGKDEYHSYKCLMMSVGRILIIDMSLNESLGHMEFILQKWSTDTLRQSYLQY